MNIIKGFVKYSLIPAAIFVLMFAGIYFSRKDIKTNNNDIKLIDSLEETIIEQDGVVINKIKVIDSLIVVNKQYVDSVSILKESNFVLEYKLERVSYYNDIAANGNNIKFLRGWINRVLDE